MKNCPHNNRQRTVGQLSLVWTRIRITIFLYGLIFNEKCLSVNVQFDVVWMIRIYLIWNLFLLGIVYVTLVNFFLVAVAVNFACLGRDVWCSIALYCSFFFTIAVTMRSNWGGSNNPFPFHLLSIIVVIIIISLQVDDYYNKTAGKKGYRAFSLSLCNHNNHLPWYCRAAQTTNAEARITKNNVS